MSYIGSTPTSQLFAPGTDTFSGTGSQTAFTLSRNVGTVNDILVVVNNVDQQPSAYSVSGSTLTLSAAPSAGTNNIYVRYLSNNLQSVIPQQGSVTPSSMVGGGIEFGMRNRLINGDMRIDQRNAGGSVTALDAYAVDRWQYEGSQTSKFTLQQNAGSVTPPAGFTNYYGATSSSAYSVTSTDFFFIGQRIEGFNVADLNWGTANAATVTLSFWVRSSLTGTFGGALTNSAANRSYPFTFTINSANTWEKETITIAGDTSGTWLTNNSLGIRLRISLGAGATYSSTAGAWAAGNFMSVTGATSVVGTNGATFYITGVQLEKGSAATPFDYRPYGTELMLCQRYLPCVNVSSTVNGDIGFGFTTGATTGIIQTPFQVTPRVPPTGLSATGVSGFSLTTQPTQTVATAITFTNATLVMARINVVGTGSPYATGAPCILLGNGSTGQIQFTGCEL